MSPAIRPASAIDIGQTLDAGLWSRYQKWLLAFAALAFGVDGLANQVLGLALPALIADWHLSRGAFAPVAALGLIGVAIGAAIGGILGDRVGRRVGLIGSVLLFGIMTTATTFVDGMSGLLVLRLLAGLGIGGAIPNGAALISEFTPFRHRSVAIAIGMVFIPVGGLLAGILGTYALPAFGWRGLFLVSGALPVLLALLFMFVLPESPRFLARHEHRRVELRVLLERCGHRFAVDAVFLDPNLQNRTSPFGALFGAGMLGNTLALWLGFFFCLLASYTMFSWVPTMLAGQGFGLAMTSVGMTAFNLGGVVGGVAGGWLIGRFGSRASVIALAAGSVAGALWLGLMPAEPGLGIARMLCSLVVEGVFIAGLHNGLYTLAAFIYPPFVRATGVGAAAAVGRIGAVLSSFTGVLTLEWAGAAGYFIVIAGATAVALVSVALVRTHIPRTQRPEADPIRPSPARP
jgi:MFS transporter, AAHS family, 4-hydroxybenzoate transporter